MARTPLTAPPRPPSQGFEPPIAAATATAGPDPVPHTVYDAFAAAVARHGPRPLLAALPETARAHGIPSGEITYAEAAASVGALRDAYAVAGYGAGHRVALLLENRPAMVLHFLALNALGASIVPVNPDLRAAELEYLLGHAEPALAVAIPSRRDDLRAAGPMPVIGPDDPPSPIDRARGEPDGRTEAALLYTSGTTGRPKGCVLSNDYVLGCGRWYVGMGGHCALREGRERMMTPLPLFHMNALCCSLMAMILSGGLPDRARPLPPAHLVGLGQGGAGHLRPLPGRRAAAADEGPTLAGRPRPSGPLRLRRRGAARAPRAVRGALRLPAGGDLGHDRDGRGRGHHRAAGAAPRRHRLLRQAQAGGRGPHPGRGRLGSRRGRAFRPTGGARPSGGVLRPLPARPRGHPEGVGGRLVPHRRRGAPGAWTARCTSWIGSRT